MCTLEDRSTAGVLRFPEFTSDIKKVTVEQTGPVRAVVKIEGMHKTDTAREWLPFTVRLYFYGGTEPVRLVHTIVFDGDDQERTSSRGSASLSPCRCASRCTIATCASRAKATDCGRNPCSRATGPAAVCQGARRMRDQLAGKRLANKETFNAAGQKLLSDWAVWDDFKLVADLQPTGSRSRSGPIRRAAGWMRSRDAARSGWCSPATSRAGSRWA